jgi:integrase
MTKRVLKRIQNASGKMPGVHVRYNPKDLTKEGTSQVFIFVYMQKKRVTFQTGVYLTPNQWDEEKCVVKKSIKGSDKMNLVIRDVAAKVNDILVTFQLKNIPVTPEALRMEYSRSSYGFDFIDFMERAIDERKGEITDSTMRLHKAILAKLQAYKSRIITDELTEEFFVNYNRYMKTTLKNDLNTRHGNIKTIRSYINIAVRKGMLEKNPVGKNPVKRGNTNRIFLTEEELKAMIELYRKKTLSESRQHVLRYFLFGCFTGLRISDIRRVTLDNIVGDILVIIPYKTKNVTGKTIKIPLSTMAKQLIEDEGPYRINGNIFNCIAEQNMRGYIKLVAKECDITKEISFHCARHTFATIFLRNTHNLAALQKVLGHANVRETMVYAHTLTEDVEKEMKFLDNF